jgi:hypothetical protein
VANRATHENHEQTVRDAARMVRGMPPEDHAERERLLWSLVLMHAGALTPVSENEKRGMERVLAILDRKIAEGGGVGGDETYQLNHNRFYRGRWSAFQECAIMLRSALSRAHEPEGTV